MVNEKKKPEQLKFTDNLRQCILKKNSEEKPKYVEVFLVNGIKLAGNITYASEKMITIGNAKKGYSTVNPMHIASYAIEPPQPKKKLDNYYNR